MGSCVNALVELVPIIGDLERHDATVGQIRRFIEEETSVLDVSHVHTAT